MDRSIKIEQITRRKNFTFRKYSEHYAELKENLYAIQENINIRRKQGNWVRNS